MCGIAGIIQPKTFEQVLDVIEAQLNQLKHRGNDSYGLLAIPKTNTISPIVIKSLKESEFKKLVKSDRKLKRAINDGLIELIIIHNRAASIGGINLNKQHPIQVNGSVYVIQNGTNHYVVQTLSKIMDSYSVFALEQIEKNDKVWYDKLSDTQAIGYLYVIARVISLFHAGKKSIQKIISRIYEYNFLDNDRLNLYTFTNFKDYNVVHISNDSIYNKVLTASLFEILMGSGVVFIYDYLNQQLIFFKDRSRTLVYNPELKVFASEPLYLESEKQKSLSKWLHITMPVMFVSNVSGKKLDRFFRIVGQDIKVELKTCKQCYMPYVYTNNPDFNHDDNYCQYCWKFITYQRASKANNDSSKNNQVVSPTYNDSLAYDVYPYATAGYNEDYYNQVLTKRWALEIRKEKLTELFKHFLEYEEFEEIREMLGSNFDFEEFIIDETFNIVEETQKIALHELHTKLHSGEVRDIETLKEILIDELNNYFALDFQLILEKLAELLDKYPQEFDNVKQFATLLTDYLYDCIA